MSTKTALCGALASVVAATTLAATPAGGATPPPLSYAAHVSGVGWLGSVTAGDTAGTTGEARRMEALKVGTSGMSMAGHVQGIGWQTTKTAPATVGTTGQSLRLEAVRLTSTIAGFAVKCQAHVEGLGWMSPVGDGQVCGTTGRALRLEAVRVWFEATGSTSSTTATIGTVKTLESLSLRDAGSSSGAVLATVPSGTVVGYTGKATASSTQIVYKGQLGWIYSYSTIEIDPPFTQGALASGTTSTRRAAVVAYAQSKLGDPYVWAASGPDAFDCSGLTLHALRQAGLDLPHSSSQQAQMGTVVSRSNLQPGDLIFWYSPIKHVSVYIGNGQMIHARSVAYGVVQQSVQSYIDAGGDYAGARRYI